MGAWKWRLNGSKMPIRGIRDTSAVVRKPVIYNVYRKSTCAYSATAVQAKFAADSFFTADYHR